VNVLLSSYVHWWNAEAAYAAVLADLLQRGGHRAWVLTRPGTFNGAQLRARGLEVVTDIALWERHPLRLRAALRRLSAFQAARRIDVVDVFRSREMAWHLLAARSRPGLRVVRTRGSALPLRGNWLNGKLYRDWSDGLIASAEAVRRQMVAALALPPERVRTIYVPIDLPPRLPPAERAAGRAALLSGLALPPDALLLAIVGRAYPEKGHDRLLEALARLAPRFPDAALLVLDKGIDDRADYVAALRERQAALGLEERVRWLGFRDDVRRLMALADVGVIPSLASEVNCRVAVEFFSVGTPVAAFPTGALPEVVEDGVSGRVARDRTPGALAAALEPLLGDAALRERLGEGARRQAETRFSRERFLAETLAAFEAALARPKAFGRRA
jgi:glycosyltransferase involved in cell wall biosynthesis